jgi:adenine-specific DNA-methyltransferase
MNYIGSKYKLSSFIKETIYSIAGNDLSKKRFCDLFAGTGIVGRILKKEVKQVISNDIEYYSFVLNRNYIGNHKKLIFEPFMDELNALVPSGGGFIYENYCLGSSSGRQYFSDANGKKIDAVRKRIETWFRKGKIDSDLYYFLLASLLEALDKIANTASVYGAFLKKLKRTAQKDLILEPALFDVNENIHEVYQADANDLIHKISGDILYLDPPYNERQYGANYHLLNTIAKYDDFKPQGKTGLRRYFRSNYCAKASVYGCFEEIVSAAKFRHIFVSYNNEGLMNVSDIEKILKKYGKYDLVKKKYQRFKADKTENRNHCADHTYEYLHILEKRQ